MPSPIQGLLDGFQATLTGNVLATDVVLPFTTAGMLPGLLYHIRIDDTNPPTTFEFCAVQWQDAGHVSVYGGTAGRGIGGTAANPHSTGAYVSSTLLRESLLPTFARLDTENLMEFSSASGISGSFFNAYGLTGAVQPTRYVGATTGGAPTTGTFKVGDFVLDTNNGVIFICVGAGTPGTWQNILDGTNTGLASAVSSLTRWVGATGGGAPGAGTWKQGDVITDRSGQLWICTAPGTPGTWKSVNPTSGPLGTLGYAQVTATQGTFTAETDITSLTVTFTPGTGRRVLLTCKIGASSSIANDVVEFRIKEGATQLQSSGVFCPNANAGFYTTFSIPIQPTAVSHTYKITGVRASGTGNITMQAGATFPAFILAEDIGT